MRVPQESVSRVWCFGIVGLRTVMSVSSAGIASYITLACFQRSGTLHVCRCLFQSRTTTFRVVIVDRFYIALFPTLGQTVACELETFTTKAGQHIHTYIRTHAHNHTNTSAMVYLQFNKNKTITQLTGQTVQDDLITIQKQKHSHAIFRYIITSGHSDRVKCTVLVKHCERLTCTYGICTNLKQTISLPEERKLFHVASWTRSFSPNTHTCTHSITSILIQFYVMSKRNMYL